LSKTRSARICAPRAVVRLGGERDGTGAVADRRGGGDLEGIFRGGAVTGDGNLCSRTTCTSSQSGENCQVSVLGQQINRVRERASSSSSDTYAAGHGHGSFVHGEIKVFGVGFACENERRLREPRLFARVEVTIAPRVAPILSRVAPLFSLPARAFSGGLF